MWCCAPGGGPCAGCFPRPHDLHASAHAVDSVTAVAAVAAVEAAVLTERARIVAVVLNWNGGDETLQCLRSLAAVRTARPVVLLADNGSVDGSVERAVAEFPELAVLRLGSNLGYAGGNNRALRHAFDALGADWVCLLNSDVVVAPDTFGALLSGALEAQEDAVPGAGAPGLVGAVGPCLLYRDRPDVVWACGGRIGPKLNVTQLLGHGGPRRAGAPHDVDYLPGACLMVSRAACDAAGLLDETFFCYLEDADWCVRIRKAHLRVVAVPGAIAYHALSSSTGGGYSAGRKYMTGVNSVHFLRKHGSIAGWAALFVFDVLLWPLAFLRGLLAGHGGAALAKLRGVIDGLRGARVDAAVAARFARVPRPTSSGPPTMTSPR
jgi:GT2 family glycosyltransferase